MADLFHRVSIRKYQEKKVEPEKLDYILRASMAAPSACNQQPWEFYIVEDPEILGELSETTPYAKLTAKAPGGDRYRLPERMYRTRRTHRLT